MTDAISDRGILDGKLADAKLMRAQRRAQIASGSTVTPGQLEESPPPNRQAELVVPSPQAGTGVASVAVAVQPSEGEPADASLSKMQLAFVAVVVLVIVWAWITIKRSKRHEQQA